MPTIIWRRMLTKTVNTDGYWRAVFIIENAPSSFRVVREDALNRVEIEGKLKSIWPISKGPHEFQFQSQALAIAEAQAQFEGSMIDGWIDVSELSLP